MEILQTMLSVTAIVSLVHKQLLQITTEILNSQRNHPRSSSHSFSTNKSTSVFPCHTRSHNSRLLGQTNWWYIITLVHCQCLHCSITNLLLLATKPRALTPQWLNVVFTILGNFLLRGSFCFSLYLHGVPTQTLDTCLSLRWWFSRDFLYLDSSVFHLWWDFLLWHCKKLYLIIPKEVKFSGILDTQVLLSTGLTFTACPAASDRRGCETSGKHFLIILPSALASPPISNSACQLQKEKNTPFNPGGVFLHILNCIDSPSHIPGWGRALECFILP